MKSKILFIGAICALTACSGPSIDMEAISNEAGNENLPEAVEPVELEFEYMDNSADPKADFYQFCNGSWIIANPVPDDKSRYSSFSEVSDKIDKRLKLILLDMSQEEHIDGSNEQILADFYASYMDTIHRDDIGTRHLDETMTLEFANSIEDAVGIGNVLAFHHPRGIGSLFKFYVEIDEKDNSQYVAYLAQGGLGLPNRGYYLNKDERSTTLRTKYKEHIGKVFALSGSEISKSDVDAIFNIEKELATNSRTQEANRDNNAKYNPHSAEEIASKYPNLDWIKYFDKIGLSKTDKIIVQQPEFFAHVDKMMNSVPIKSWSLYLSWKVLNKFETMMTSELNAENFDFYSRTMRGKKVMQDDWKRAIQRITMSPINEILGKRFVDVKFSEADKIKVNEMVDNITTVFEERIGGLEWMSDETKVKAKEKLHAFARKLGFPDKWKTYEGLQISDSNYLENSINLSQYRFNDKMEKLNNSIDKSLWEMPAHMVNAYYNPALNEIVFPAGIMQNPFFDPGYEDAVNYARMGAVIGHELTHGFDDQGAKYAADGNLQNWWTFEDSVKFAEKTEKLISQYNQFEVLDGVFIKGKLTLGENIADFGGLTIAYYAYLKSLEGKERTEINGYTNEQRFFIAFGQVWKNTIKDDELITRVNTDYHSPGKYRVNGTLGNMPEFFEAFDVKEGDPMRQSADKIAKIW
ncbi:MAG: putative endopeptidase [Parvicellaceae bacterium]|jgi:putative endopeptidase